MHCSGTSCSYKRIAVYVSVCEARFDNNFKMTRSTNKTVNFAIEDTWKLLVRRFQELELLKQSNQEDEDLLFRQTLTQTLAFALTEDNQIVHIDQVAFRVQEILRVEIMRILPQFLISMDVKQVRNHNRAFRNVVASKLSSFLCQVTCKWNWSWVAQNLMNHSVCVAQFLSVGCFG